MSRTTPGRRHAPPPRPAPAATEPLPPLTVRVRLAIAAILACATLLMLWHLDHGLPDLLEEALPLKLALGMFREGGRIDWNPHFFNYPSLSLYLHLLVQRAMVMAGTLTGAWRSTADYLVLFDIAPRPAVLAARGLSVACELVTLLCVARIGERLHRGAGLLAAALLALSPTAIDTSRSIFTDTMMTAFAALSLERLLMWRREQRPHQLLWAAACAGLAASAKYPGAVLLLPIAAVLVERRGPRGVLLWAGACAVALAAFALTSPFVLLDFQSFIRDFTYESQHVSEGHFGSLGRHGLGYVLRTLSRDLGWLGMLAWALSLPIMLREGTRRGAERALWLFAAPLLFSIAGARVEAERYVMPILPVAALLACGTACDLLGRTPERARRAVAMAGVLLLLAPVAIAGFGEARRGGDDTQVAARRWMEATLAPGDLILREGYTGNLFTSDRREQILASRSFSEAGPDVRQRVENTPAHHAVDLPLNVSGRFGVTFVGPGGVRTRHALFEHPSDFNRAFYDPRLLAGSDYVATSSAVRDRYHADSARYAAQSAFYRYLDDSLALAARFSPARDSTGPEIRVFRITRADWARLDSGRGTLPPLWWAESIPTVFREEFMRLQRTEVTPSALAPARPDGMPGPWLQTIAPFHRAKVEPFEHSLATAHAVRGAFDRALPLAEDAWRMHPEDTKACLDLARVLLRLERWQDLAQRVDSTMVRVSPADPGIAELLVQRAFAHVQLNQIAAARADLEEAIRREPESSDTGRRARIGLAQITVAR